jgi:hypothetical protein
MLVLTVTALLTSNHIAAITFIFALKTELKITFRQSNHKMTIHSNNNTIPRSTKKVKVCS